MKEYDLKSAEMLESFKDWSKQHFGSCRHAFNSLDTDDGASVTLGELKRATGEFQREFMRAQQEVQNFKEETIAEAKKGLNIPPRPGISMDIPSAPQPRIATPAGERMAATKPTGPAFKTPGKNEKAPQPEASPVSSDEDVPPPKGA